MIRSGRPAHPDILTPREQEVLALLREGLTNPQIAERLSITLDGAKYHVSEILSKLGVSSREEAARWEPPERPWWASAFAPLAWPWRRANVSWFSTGGAGITAVLVMAGIALLVWGLVRTDGGANSSDDTFLQNEPTLALSSPTVSPPTPALTAEPTPAQPMPTAGPATPQPTAQPTSTTEPVPTATVVQLTDLAPRVDCPNTMLHLDIDKLRLQPGLGPTEALITEVDEDQVSIVIDGAEILVRGWGKVVGFGGYDEPSDEVWLVVARAVDAVRYEC